MWPTPEQVSKWISFKAYLFNLFRLTPSFEPKLKVSKVYILANSGISILHPDSPMPTDYNESTFKGILPTTDASYRIPSSLKWFLSSTSTSMLLFIKKLHIYLTPNGPISHPVPSNCFPFKALDSLLINIASCFLLNFDWLYTNLALYSLWKII